MREYSEGGVECHEEHHWEHALAAGLRAAWTGPTN